MAWVEKFTGLVRCLQPKIPAPPWNGISSVLVPLGLGDSGCDIVLTKRTQSVQTHRGQISFPGGFFQKGDSDLQSVALREAREEVGVKSNDLNMIGPLTPVLTQLNNTVIVPWVAFLRLPYPFHLNPSEVDKLILLKMKDLCERGLQKVTVKGIGIQSIGIDAEGELIWGATARILVEIQKLLLTSGINFFATK